MLDRHHGLLRPLLGILGVGLVTATLVLPRSLLSPQTESELAPYARLSKSLRGSFHVAGSEVMKSLLQQWQVEFRTLYPEVAILLETAGTTEGIAALVRGAAEVAALSRELTRAEQEAFTERHGYPPAAFAVAIDAIAIYVHRENPLTGLTLTELDAIFSTTRRRGAPTGIDRWDQLGLPEQWRAKPIRLYGLESGSATTHFLREVVLMDGQFNESIQRESLPADVVAAVTQDQLGIGYGSIGYKTSGVRPLALARVPGGPFVEPSVESARTGTYPLSRQLYLYVNRPPRGRLRGAIHEFLKYVCSRQGQQAVQKAGFYPLPSDRLKAQLAALATES